MESDIETTTTANSETTTTTKQRAKNDDDETNNNDDESNIFHGEKILPEGYKPGDKDILCGRGKGSTGHTGNKSFAKVIQANLQQYVEAQKRIDKSVVVSTVLYSLKQKGTRFLKFDKKNTQRWYEIDEEQARDKIGHAIRDLSAGSRSKRKNPQQQQHDNAPPPAKQQKKKAAKSKKGRSCVKKHDSPGENNRNATPEVTSVAPTDTIPPLTDEEPARTWESNVVDGKSQHTGDNTAGNNNNSNGNNVDPIPYPFHSRTTPHGREVDSNRTNRQILRQGNDSSLKGSDVYEKDDRTATVTYSVTGIDNHINDDDPFVLAQRSTDPTISSEPLNLSPIAVRPTAFFSPTNAYNTPIDSNQHDCWRANHHHHHHSHHHYQPQQQTSIPGQPSESLLAFSPQSVRSVPETAGAFQSQEPHGSNHHNMHFHSTYQSHAAAAGAAWTHPAHQPHSPSWSTTKGLTGRPIGMENHSGSAATPFATSWWWPGYSNYNQRTTPSTWTGPVVVSPYSRYVYNNGNNTNNGNPYAHDHPVSQNVPTEQGLVETDIVSATAQTQNQKEPEAFSSPTAHDIAERSSVKTSGDIHSELEPAAQHEASSSRQLSNMASVKKEEKKENQDGACASTIEKNGEKKVDDGDGDNTKPDPCTPPEPKKETFDDFVLRDWY